MKQKDIAMIVLVAGIAAVVSFAASHAIFGSTGNRAQKAEAVDAITTDFVKPSTKYFNNESIDPTQLIQIGDSSNANPFAAGQ